jgi:glycosyltransferase involved in cell wall biosynthesis
LTVDTQKSPSLMARTRRLLRRAGQPRTPLAPLLRGMTLISHQPRWIAFSIGRGATAVELSGKLEGATPGLERSVLARIRVFDREDRSLDHQLSGLRISETAGKYFYALEYVRDDVLRFSFALPANTARVEVALQHWARADKTRYLHGPLSLNPVAAVVNAPSRVSANAGEAAREKLREAERDLRGALRTYVERLAAVPGPLYADDVPFGEPLAEYLIHDEGLVEPGLRLAGRRLRAGRDREAIALIGLGAEPELVKADGRRRLHQHMAGLPRRPAASPQIKHRSLVYLLHNALPYDSGGYAARSHGLLRGYVKAGWEVQAFTRPGYPEDRGHKRGPATQVIDGVTYHTLDDAGPGATADGADQITNIQRFAEQVLKRLEGESIGVVQAASFFQNGFAGRTVADRLGVPLVYEMRGMEWLTRSSNDPRWLDSEQCRLMIDLEQMAARDADHVFTITGALRDWVISGGVEADRVTVLPNGCSSDLFAPIPRDEALAEELGVGDSPVVAYIGSFAAYEGIPEIISATARARESSGLDIRLLLVGDGQLSPVVEQHILETEADGYVIRTGRVPHDRIPAYYSVADALVLARRDLPLTQMISPLKPLEALSMGKHVISTNVAAVSEMLNAAGVGRIVANGAPFGLAHAIAEAANDRETLAGQSTAARQWAVEQRDWGVLAGQALDDLQARFAAKPRSRSKAKA